MFVDELNMKLQAGDGGNGTIAFRREKHVEFGGPFGGNGGGGADIVFQADEGINTLVDLYQYKFIKGERGDHGGSKGKHGKKAEDIVIKVPVGTVVKDVDSDEMMADLVKHGQRATIAKGGRGGRGNIAFATSSNPAPSIAENGEPGEEKNIKVELKMLADVGLVGMPSVGKSTIISKISSAKPKIADYHFTTLQPNLGVVSSGEGKSFVVADLPGLIKGASQGKGLGDRFLKHIERTKIIAHVIDMGSFEQRDPVEDYQIINKELASFSEKLMTKPQVIIANKMDIPWAAENLKKFKEKVNKPVLEISAINQKGLLSMVNTLAKMLSEIEDEKEEEIDDHVVYKFTEKDDFRIYRENDVWVVRGQEIEKLVKMTNFTTDESIDHFAYKLRKKGIDDKLKAAGVKEGDLVRILDFEFEYHD